MFKQAGENIVLFLSCSSLGRLKFFLQMLDQAEKGSPETNTPAYLFEVSLAEEKKY